MMKPHKCLHRTVRKGSTVAELLVAATLLVTFIGIVSQITVHSGRLWQTTRQQQFALDELSNQLELLCAMSSSDCKKALAKLEPSKEAREGLIDPKLKGEWIEDENGSRVLLEIQWEGSILAKPISLTGWIVPIPDSKSEGGES